MEQRAADNQYTPNHPIPGAEPEAKAAAMSRTYWQQTLRDFRRGKLAMVALGIVFFIVTVAVFCPLISNERPYYIRMQWAAQYDGAYAVVLDLAERLLGTELDASTRSEYQKNLERAFDRMQHELQGEQRVKLEEFARELTAATSAPNATMTPQVRARLDAFEQQFDLAEVQLRATSRYPAFRSLTRREVFFIALYLLAVPLWFLRARFGSFPRYLGVCLAGAGLICLAWALVFSSVQDAFKYRLAYESPTFGQNKDWVVLPALVPFGENENITQESRQAPTWWLKPEQKVPNQHYHVLGTDTTGRDVLARMIYGSRISMMIGIVAVGIYVTIGIILGAMAGYFGGWTDLALSRIMEVVICVPPLFLILSVQAYLQPSIINIMVALGLISWTGVARLERGEFLRLVNLDFVQAVRALGGSNTRIIFRHILPNALGPILVLVSFGMAGSILVESALSFLGFGVPQPTASWGDLLNNGRADIQGTWWLTVFPGIAIFLTVTCFNLIGEGVRDALDPRRQH